MDRPGHEHCEAVIASLEHQIASERARLLALLSRARRGTTKEGAPCWCDDEEARNERLDFGEHTQLCRDITRAQGIR